MTKTIKHCPFCDSEYPSHLPGCALIALLNNAEIKVSEWNSRPIEDALQVEIGQLCNEAERVKELSRELHNAKMQCKLLSEEIKRVRMALMPILDSEDPGEYVEKLVARDHAQKLEILRLRSVASHQEAILNTILQPGEWWLELRRGYKGAGEHAVEWLSEYGKSYGLAEQRVIEAIRDALKAMVKH